MLRRPTALLAMNPTNRDRLFDAETRARLGRSVEVDLGLVATDFADPAVAGVLDSVEVLVTCWGCPPVDAAVLDRAPKLRAIVHGAGTVKGIVTPACRDRGLLVSSAVAANAVPVAEYTLAMILLANKQVFPIADDYREHRVRRDWTARFPGFGNYRRTVGIIGASRVGRRVLELLGPHDLDVLLADPTIDRTAAAELGAELVELDELLRRSDVVSLHAPNLPETRGLLDAGRLALIGDGATFINTARGQLVDTAALTAELESGRFRAVLDVTDPEPLPPDSPLYRLPNVLLTPHVAGSLGGEIARMGASAVAEVERYAAGEPFRHGVPLDGLDLLA